MRTILRAGAIALAAGSIVLSGGIAAQAAPTAGIQFTVSQLILNPGEHGHTGSLSITIHNNTDSDWDGVLTLVEPIAQTALRGDGLTCGNDRRPDGRDSIWCNLWDVLPAGATRNLSYDFQSPAAPKPVARISEQPGSVELDGVTREFPAILRSTTGSLSNPVPYRPATDTALTVTAPDQVTLTRQDDGTYAGKAPVTVRNNNDAPHSGFGAELAIPAGLDEFPYADGGICGPGGELPAPAGGSNAGCFFDSQLAEGESRTLEWLITAPATAAPGVAGTATTSAKLANGSATPQTDGANQTTFSVVIAD